MKKLLFMLLLVSMPIVARADWVSGVVTNPAAGAVLVDTGPLSAGSRSALVIVAATVATRFRYQWRDAANTNVVQEQYFIVPANGTVVLPTPVAGQEYTMQEGERLRVIVDAGITGSASASLFFQR